MVKWFKKAFTLVFPHCSYQNKQKQFRSKWLYSPAHHSVSHGLLCKFAILMSGHLKCAYELNCMHFSYICSFIKSKTNYHESSVMGGGIFLSCPQVWKMKIIVIYHILFDCYYNKNMKGTVAYLKCSMYTIMTGKLEWKRSLRRPRHR